MPVVVSFLYQRFFVDLNIFEIELNWIEKKEIPWTETETQMEFYSSLIFMGIFII